jgi:hypothetical protein
MSAATWLTAFGGFFATLWIVAGPFIKAKRVIDDAPDATRRDT